ncbi:hypothetical protein OS493_031177 [Desmophyllum pertusum]|uniref:Fe2OG dioxygenase domain-containing protein n=1 Tax=Desmophyllum pertusum TaxID=174260 RepID=A0A9X0D0T6_9CNID|nr:hypothetical protein OS493_031177 [Desmophyllum pertusum]
MELSKGTTHTVRTLSVQPPVFEIPNFFTDEECEMIIDLALEKEKISLKELEQTSLEKLNAYYDKEKLTKPRLRSRSSQQVWLWHDDDELLQYEGLLEDYHERLEQLTKLPKPILQQSEPVQVARYKEEGFFHCHHDSEAITHDKPCCLYGSNDCRQCRYLTIMVFLNDVEEGGECAFPVADNTTFDWEAWSNESPQSCNMVKHCDKSNLVIKPQRGKALLWYNHVMDDTNRWLGNRDPFSYHGGCQVKKGEKWIASIWININGDGKEELRAWKMGHNWLAPNNHNKEIIHALQSEIAEETKTENRYTRDKNEFENKEKLDAAENVMSKNEASSMKDNVMSKNEASSMKLFDER